MDSSRSRWIASIGWIGGGLLMWVANQLDWQWPPWMVLLVASVSVICLVITAVLAVQLAYDWMRRQILEPSHFIVMGLAGVWIFATIALIGVVWQQSKPSQVSVATANSGRGTTTTTFQNPPSEQATAGTAQDKARREAIISSLRTTYPDRVIADVTPEYIMDQYNDKMTVEADSAVAPFIESWHVVSGTIRNITVRRKHDFSIVTLARTDDRTVLMYFYEESIDRISVMTSGQTIFALCRLKRAGNYALEFDPCELLDENIGLTSVPR